MSNRNTATPSPNAINAIPTVYAGVRFRSRLESRWAAFFDLVKWRWDYEPLDFNGWIPDFVLIGAKQVTYVEVKPTYVFVPEVARKIDASGCTDEVLIVGAGNPIRVWGNYCGPGWLREWTDDGKEAFTVWDAAPYGIWECNRDGVGFCSADGSYIDRISGGYDGGSWGGIPDQDLDLTIAACWREAGNCVRWEPHSRIGR